MKTSRLLVLALPLFAPSFISAQEQALAKPVGQAAQEASAKPLTVLGKVSSDGNTLLTDIDSEWTVSNAAVLKGYEGRRVSVRCYVDSEKGQIKILSVRRDESNLKYAAQHGDAAFRR